MFAASVLGKLFYPAFIHMTIVSPQLLALNRDYAQNSLMSAMAWLQQLLLNCPASAAP
jgi:hypothetical protein